jgi:hypothetical protein
MLNLHLARDKVTENLHITERALLPTFLNRLASMCLEVEERLFLNIQARQNFLRGGVNKSHCQNPLQDRELLPIEEDSAEGPIRLLVAVTGLCSLASSKSRIRAARLSCVIGFWIIATPASSRPWWTMAFRE